jgi:hypothetical protein
VRAVALTGVPLIVLVLLATAAAATGTVLMWPRGGRWRAVQRSVGVLLSEALLVLSVGLIANRHEEFYPSWQALAGDTGTASATARRPAGRLDAALAGDPRVRTLPWHPAGAASWRLSGHADVTVPYGYATKTSVTYPALLVLGGRAAVAGLVGVAVHPSARTTAAALATLPAALGADLRVTSHGWALAASARHAALAARLIADEPGRFVALVVVGGPTAVRPRAGLAVAEALAPRQRGAVPPGVTRLAGGWAAAGAWAAGQTPPPLAAPEVLPSAAVS